MQSVPTPRRLAVMEGVPSQSRARATMWAQEVRW